MPAPANACCIAAGAGAPEDSFAPPPDARPPALPALEFALLFALTEPYTLAPAPLAPCGALRACACCPCCDLAVDPPASFVSYDPAPAPAAPPAPYAAPYAPYASAPGITCGGIIRTASAASAASAATRRRAGARSDARSTPARPRWPPRCPAMRLVSSRPAASSRPAPAAAAAAAAAACCR
eukprot:30489-Pelagococcus_subviridis.AAC.1